MSVSMIDLILDSNDGFSTAYQRKQARAELEQLRAQARQLAQARNLIDQSETDAVAISNMADGYVSEMAEHLANQLGRWLAANPVPQEGK